MSAHIRKTAVPAKNSRKSQATRARIMQTATDFISERGSTDFQMNEISDRCNLSKGALYYYFIDKADLMDAIFDQVIGDLVEQVEEAVSTAHTPLETIAGIVVPGKLPVIAGEEGIAKYCGVATLTISYYDIGTATGEMAVDILLNGADVSAMPIQAAPQFTKKFNAEIAAELGVAIPDGYTAIE